MRQANFLEKLLDGSEVEWMPLSKLAEVRSGWGFPNAYQGQTEGKHPFYKVSDMNSVGNETVMNQANNYIDDQTVKKLGVSLAPAGTVIFPKIGAAVATNKKRLLLSPSAYDNNVMGLIPSEKILSRFLFYWMQTINLSMLANDSGAVPSIRKSEMELLPIPIPCPDDPKKSLAIQAEIVRILDTFTALTAELTAELTARKKQYNYYRDKLLTFSDDADIEWKSLDKVAEYSKTRIDYESLDGKNYVGVDNLLQNRAGKVDSNYVPTSGKLTQYKVGDILLGNIRPYLKKIWHADRVGGTNGDVLVIHPTDKNINPRYLYQVLAGDKFFEYNMQHAKGAKMPRGNKPKIMEYNIPIPYANDPKKSLAEQARIATILDKFDALTNSISEGLPREIELRQKQYEYYRDLLLSFPKPIEEAA